MNILLPALLALPACAPAFAQERPAALEAAQSKARELRLSGEKQWRLLLHFGNNFLGNRSEASNKSFFLSPRGRKDPKAELESTLAAFYAPPGKEPDQHALCRFPARAAWLKEKLALQGLPEVDCSGYRIWRQDLSPDSVSLVFASAYLANPSSMYGHTFLRMDQKAHGPGEKLLDNAVNYAAIAPTDSGFLFAVFGLTGFYPGRYSAMPYYLKVQEYSDMESRDLWEYRLHLDSAAVDRLAAHIWEMGSAEFPYYFLNRNCSYQLLPLLEAAEPKLRLTEHYPLYVIPIDTVKALAAQPGLLGEAVFRPSLSTKMLAHRAALSPEEASLAKDLAAGCDAWARLAALPAERQVRVLDTASDVLQYKMGFVKAKREAAADLERKLLVARGRLGLPSPPDAIVVPPRPDAGHETGRLDLGWGFGDRRFVEFQARAAMHDLLDAPMGYPPNSVMEMFEATLRYDAKNERTYLHKADLVDILSLSPRDPWIKKPSWAVELGWHTADELQAAPWKAGYVGAKGGTGLAASTAILGLETWYALVEADGGAGGVFKDDFRAGAGGTAGVYLRPTSFWRARLDGSYFVYGLANLGDKRPQGRLRLEQAVDLSKRVALRATLERVGRDDQAILSLRWYF